MLNRVLVVDDETQQRRLYRRLLEADGYVVLDAASAREALRVVAGAASRPDLILCDVAMPGTDGVALVRALLAAPETSAIPVILMTGLSIPRGVLDAASEALGIVPVFVKGGDPAALLERAALLIRANAPRRAGVVVDPLKRVVRVGGLRLPELPARRFQLLCALLREPREMSREELLERVWDGKDNLNVVDVTVLRLRRDLRGYPSLRIETMPAGYRLVVGASADAPIAPV
ncbi:MAG: response regulator transcription factor [Elusimicrobia bacterium]|nr:response regulator transcription factor [Elusimicrobiota bacterium]